MEPNPRALDALHRVKNEAARTAAKRVLLESDLTETEAQLAAHEAGVARRNREDSAGGAVYPPEDRLADARKAKRLCAERDEKLRALRDLDAQDAVLSARANAALADRIRGNMDALRDQLDERLDEVRALRLKLAQALSDVDLLGERHEEARQALTKLTGSAPPSLETPPLEAARDEVWKAAAGR